VWDEHTCTYSSGQLFGASAQLTRQQLRPLPNLQISSKSAGVSLLFIYKEMMKEKIHALRCAAE
jgi:hypothetical protein